MEENKITYVSHHSIEFVVVGGFLVANLIWRSLFIAQRITPIWDGGVYLTLARNMLLGQSLYEWFRPLLFSGIVAAIWSVTGDNYLFVRYFNLLFTLASAVVLYYVIRAEMGKLAAFAAMVFYVTALQVLLWSDHILVHGLTTLFSLLTIPTLKTKDARMWVIGGTFAALSILARYTSIVLVIPILVGFTIHHKRPQLLLAAVLGAAIPISLYHAAYPSIFPNFLQIWLRYGQNTGTPGPWYYYLIRWNKLFGIIGFLGLLALLFPSTYKSIDSRPWALWLVGSLLFFSITINKQDRFTFEWTPAVAYLSICAFQKICTKVPSFLSRLKRTGVLGGHMKVLLASFFILLLAFQIYSSVGTYLPIQRSFAKSRDNDLILVAEYMEKHTPQDSIFISDHLAPDLTYFSNRKVNGIWKTTGESDFLEYLQRYIRVADADYIIIFPKIKGNSPDILERSGFLELEAVIDAKALGKVYLFSCVSNIG